MPNTSEMGLTRNHRRTGVLPHYDAYAVMLNLRPAERDAFVDDAIAVRQSAAAGRPVVIVNLPLRRFLDSLRPIRWMTRLARS